MAVDRGASTGASQACIAIELAAIPSITDWRVGMRFQGPGGSRLPLVIAVVALIVALVLIYVIFIV